MKISHKIIILVAFLLFALGMNTYIGLSQLSKVGHELRMVANKNNTLSTIIHTIAEHQLEKAILFERLLRVAEELGFEQNSPARRMHLQDHARLSKRGFDDLTELSAVNIIHGKEIIDRAMNKAVDQEHRDDVIELKRVMEKIETAHIRFDEVVGEVFSMVTSGDYQLSLEDMDVIQRKERNLSEKFKILLKNIQHLTQKSMLKAEREEEVAKRVLSISFILITLITGLVAYFLIRSFLFRLMRLEMATHKISSGDYVVDLKDSSSDEIGAVSTAFSVMAKKLNEAKLELERKNQDLEKSLVVTNRQKRDLQKVNKELDNFVHTVSHDIRSPLMGVMGYASILQNEYEQSIDKRGQRCVTGIRRGIDRLNAMINDLLDLTRIARIKNPYEEIAIQDLLDEILARLEFRIVELNAEVHVRDSLPTIVCDRIKLGEVFLNLIGNGVKFASKNPEASPVLEIGYIEQKDHHEFIVRDNGIGINPEEHHKVFGIFQRLESAREFEGTGTGLSIVKGVIEDHGGKIWIESQVGEGAAFHFTIPKGLRAR